jgi:lipopolysaccharide export system permease protein
MILKTYILYIVKTYLQNFVKVFFIFFSLVFLISIFEEISYFKETDKSIFFVLFMTILNTPAVVYLIAPFIFLISTQSFFMELFRKDELSIFKSFGLSNIKILSSIISISIICCLVISIFFYNLSAKLQFVYLDYKNQHSKDNKYLAMITENGLWIKVETDQYINLINAERMNKNILQDVTITVLDKSFKLIKNITSKKVNILSNDWIMIDPKTVNFDSTTTYDSGEIIFKSNLDYKKINSLFSNLSSLTFFELNKLKKSYIELNYTTEELDLHILRLYSQPFYMVIMTLLASIIMFNIKRSHENYIYIILGVSISVMIYYIIYLFSLLGINGNLSVNLSVWIPLIIIFLVSTIGLVRLNEK